MKKLKLTCEDIVTYVHICIWTFLFAVVIVLYGVFTTYSSTGDPLAPAKDRNANYTGDNYPMWQDVHVMIYLGFGFLYTFLKAHSWASVTLNWICAAWTMLTAMLWIGLWERVWFAHFTDKIGLSIRGMIDGDFCAGAALIAFGVVLGKVNTFQSLFIGTIIGCFYSLNYTLLAFVYGVSDLGGSMYIHTFGAIFGVMCSWAYMNPKEKDQKHCGSSYHSNLFGIIGSLFLWMYWPSFNGAL